MPAQGRRRPGRAKVEAETAQAWMENGQNAHAAARQLDIPISTAAQRLRGPGAQGVLMDYIKAQYEEGLSPTTLYQELKKRLRAKKTVVNMTKEGEVITTEVDDNETQMQALKLAFEIPIRIAQVMKQPVEPAAKQTFTVDLEKLATMSDDDLLDLNQRLTRHSSGQGGK